MKAAVFEGIENIQVREIEKPVCTSDGILMRVEACGICGSDIRNFHVGLKGNVASQVMGHEVTGVVEEVGKAVSRFSPGERIAIAPDVSCGECYYCRRGLVNLCENHRMVGTHWPGGFAQFLLLPREVIEHGFVSGIPDGCSLIDATMSEPASSVLAAQENAGVGPGDTVLVIGDGPIGCLHIEVARARGASTVIMAGLTRLALARQFGPDHLIDAGSQNTVEEVRRITGGLGADIAICANPVAATQEQAVESVRKRGKVVLFGGVPKTAPMTTLNSNIIHYGELTIMGAFSYPATAHARALQLIADRKINAAAYVTERVPLERIVDGIRMAEQGKALKVVVMPWM